MNYASDTELADVICDYVNTCFESRKHYFEPFENQSMSRVEPKCTRSGRLPREPVRLIVTKE